MTTLLHDPGDKITPLYPAYMHPSFVQQTYFSQFRELEVNDPDQVLLIKYQPWHIYPEYREFIFFMIEISQPNAPLPQLVFISYNNKHHIYDHQSPTDID